MNNSKLKIELWGVKKADTFKRGTIQRERNSSKEESYNESGAVQKRNPTTRAEQARP